MLSHCSHHVNAPEISLYCCRILATDWEKYMMCDRDDCNEAAVHFEAGAGQCEECFEAFTSIDKFFYTSMRIKITEKRFFACVRGMGVWSVQRLDNLAVKAEEQKAKRLAEKAAKHAGGQARVQGCKAA